MRIFINSSLYDSISRKKKSIRDARVRVIFSCRVNFARVRVIFSCRVNFARVRVIFSCRVNFGQPNILLTKTAAAQNDDALSYYTVRGLYFLAVVFVRSVAIIVVLNITIREA